MLESIAVYLIDIAALAFLCYLIYSNNILNQNQKVPFYLGTVLTGLIVLLEAGTMIAGERYANLRIMNIICNVFGFALSPVIPVILIGIIDIKIIKSNKTVMLPSLINIFAAALSPWYGFVFYVDANNHYERGDYFFLFVAAYLINLMILLFSTVRKREKHYYPIRAKIVVLSLFVAAGTGIQLIHPSVNCSWHSVTFSLFLYFSLLSDFDGSFDALTRLYNRAAYEKAVKKLDGRKPYSIIVIDINDFKEINDTYGHDFGDEVLKKVTSIIRKSYGNDCSSYRVGGDEFHIISRETEPERLECQLKYMTDNLEIVRRDDGRLPTVSYGYGIFISGKMTCFQEVYKEADDQMYYFKKLHKEKC